MRKTNNKVTVTVFPGYCIGKISVATADCQYELKERGAILLKVTVRSEPPVQSRR